MFWSKTFIPTLRQDPQEAEIASHKLLLRAGFIRMLAAGAYTYLPLGLRVLNNIKCIIREEMNSVCAAELLLPALQPMELWQKTGRDKDLGEVMIRFIDRRGRHMALGPTHEEVITELVKDNVSSYRQLPMVLYQIQTKFRDEIRPRFGLIRACEFVMKDAYSFDKDEAGLDHNYEAMYNAYTRIFKRCGLDVRISEADSGVMGGKVSHEFMVSAQEGEDAVLVCPKCAQVLAYKEGVPDVCAKCSQKMERVNCIEVGHIFKLGTKYSSSLGANFLDSQGKLQPILMGCYGIGVSRLVSAIIEQNHDAGGMLWPKEISPYKVILLPLDVTDKQIIGLSTEAYEQLTRAGVDVLFDDRDERAGVKFKDADLLGIPLQLIMGKEALKTGKLELKFRSTQEKCLEEKQEIYKRIIKWTEKP